MTVFIFGLFALLPMVAITVFGMLNAAYGRGVTGLLMVPLLAAWIAFMASIDMIVKDVPALCAIYPWCQ